jgi:hypothetical protein
VKQGRKAKEEKSKEELNEEEETKKKEWKRKREGRNTKTCYRYRMERKKGNEDLAKESKKQ